MSEHFSSDQPPLVEAGTDEAAEAKPFLTPPSSPPSRADIQRVHTGVDAYLGGINDGSDSDIEEFPELMLRRPTEVTNSAE